jgi:hypothetical protein
MIYQAFPQETQTAISFAKQNPIRSTKKTTKNGCDRMNSMTNVSSSFWQRPLLLYSHLMDPSSFVLALFLLGFFYMLMVSIPFLSMILTNLSNWTDLMNSTSPFFGLSWFQLIQLIF